MRLGYLTRVESYFP